jgi:RND family efflux transporter MFP subunit
MKCAIALMAILILGGAAHAADEKKGGASAPGGQPPSVVVVKTARTGRSAPAATYIGTVAYERVAEVAAEVEGVVREVKYAEGERVARGDVLVRLGADLLDASIAQARATVEQAGHELAQAEKDLARTEALVKSDSVAVSVYDDRYHGTEALRRKVDGLRAALDRLILQKEKKTIAAPFGGIVVARSVVPGEWVGAGGTVAVLADDSALDVLVSVPADVLSNMNRDRMLEMTIGGRAHGGRFLAVIPRGDVSSRTFTVKVRLKNPGGGLYEGMEAEVRLPSGPETAGLLVPRDAVLNVQGRDVVYTVADGAARLIPVTVRGYAGDEAGVAGEGLADGMDVIVKGHERLRDGQPVTVKTLTGGGR